MSQSVSDGACSECPICLEEIGETNKITTKCGHIFHASCIIQNLHVSQMCPLCREVIDDQPRYDRQNTLDSIDDDDVESFVDTLTNDTGNNRRVASDIVDLLQSPRNINDLIDEVTRLVANSAEEFAFDFTYLLRDFVEGEQEDRENSNRNTIQNNIQYINEQIPTIRTNEYPVNNIFNTNNLGLTLNEVENLLQE